MKNRVTLERWNNGERPEKLYHITPMENVIDILEDGLKKVVEIKNFKETESKVYLADSIEFCEDYMIDLFAKALANKFESKEDVKTIKAKFVIFEVNVSKLNVELLEIDDLFTSLKENEYIKSYKYNGEITCEAIELIPNIYEQVYLKEELVTYL